ncbi:hypothetical protein KY290_038049 [Solanum tuberosum]|uniref:Uncharacterized protein n=1 Tax=Solanum tuberosum TaxID=4113 RepID=A0ABQ7TXB5_SOLTU|nr:hypothetical protein KY284_034923 [Solanum tuberosum]KAH0637668.1 hypothetical protein KY289_037583 [Solanum tuberosum]KAH0640801.1 hypothetical protein KY285_037387 [Solanum tuberosum]KAH0739344.1 hypothetical protein KY290_038049 [Solanum tuberosum]
MGFVSTILGFCGFGVGVSCGLTIGYYLFIYFQPCDVKVLHSSVLFFCFCFNCYIHYGSTLYFMCFPLLYALCRSENEERVT